MVVGDRIYSLYKEKYILNENYSSIKERKMDRLNYPISVSLYFGCFG